MNADQQFVLALVVAVLGFVSSTVAAFLSLRNGAKADKAARLVARGNRLTKEGNDQTQEVATTLGEVKTLANGNLADTRADLAAARQQLGEALAKISELSLALTRVERHADATDDLAQRLADKLKALTESPPK